MLDTSIIIAVYNDFRTLELILAALDCQTADDFEVVVADDGSGEEMVAFSRKSKNRLHIS